MNTTALRWIGYTLTLATAALSAGCSHDAPLGPERRPAFAAQLSSDDARPVDLGSCDSLAAPEGSTLAFHAYAEGVQIYRWDGASWVFVAPSAVLYADAGGNGAVAIHFAGPTWQSVSGSTVVGAVLKRCTPDATAIPWLLLRAASSGGPGIFDGTTFIQRVNTVGGKAPAAPGSVTGEIANVAYTAEYLFYR